MSFTNADQFCIECDADISKNGTHARRCAIRGETDSVTANADTTVQPKPIIIRERARRVLNHFADYVNGAGFDAKRLSGEDVPALLAENERLRATIARVRERAEKYRDWIPPQNVMGPSWNAGATFAWQQAGRDFLLALEPTTV